MTNVAQIRTYVSNNVCNLPLDCRVQNSASDSPAMVEVHVENPYNTITEDTLVMIWYPG